MVSELDFGPFLDLPEAARRALAASGRPVSFARGDHLIRAGSEPGEAFALLAGRVRVIAPGGARLATMRAPGVVGEIAALTGERRTADVLAAGPVRALRLEASALRAVATSNEAFARTLYDFAEARRTNTFLRGQGPFADLPAAETEALASKLRPVHLEAGAVLVRQGERGDDVFLIRHGEVEAARTDGASERVLSRSGPGALIGEIAVLTGSARTATVRAVTQVEALLIPGEDVRAVVKRHRRLQARVMSVMEARHSPKRLGDPHIEAAPDDPSAVILHDEGRDAYLRLDPQALAIYRDLDGERTLRELAMRHFERTGALDPQAVFATVAALQIAGFATAPRVAADSPNGRMLRVADAVLAPRAEIADADGLATALHRALAPLFSQPGAAVALVVGIAGVIAAIPVLRTASPGDFGLGGILVAFGGLLLAGIGHEISHAIAAKAEGSRIGRAGVGLFWFTPVVYVDTSSTWSISRWARIRVNAAGPLFNLACAGAFGLAARYAGGRAQDVLVWLALTNVLLVVFNLSPLLEFDGYYVLSDLTDTNALRRKAMRFVFGDLLRRPRRPASRREAGFLAYTVAALLYVLAMSAIALAGVSQVANNVLGAFVGDPARAVLGLILAAGFAVLLLLPFVTEALEARSHAGLGAA